MGQEIEIFSSTGYKYTSPKINSTLKKDLALKIDCGISFSRNINHMVVIQFSKTILNK